MLKASLLDLSDKRRLCEFGLHFAIIGFVGECDTSDLSRVAIGNPHLDKPDLIG